MKKNKSKDSRPFSESIMNEMRKDMGVKKTKKGKLLSFFVVLCQDLAQNKMRSSAS